MDNLDGIIDDRFAPLAQILSDQLTAGYDLGASLAVAVDGELVTDCWGGWADEAQTRPWESDTVTNVWSTTKTMTALSALLLIDRGQLDPDEKVATYWPDIEVRHLMSHTSGVSAWAQPVSVDDVLDDDKATEMLAGQAPWWEPGTASGYSNLPIPTAGVPDGLIAPFWDDLNLVATGSGAGPLLYHLLTLDVSVF